MGNCIHGVNYDAVKNTVPVYMVYKTYSFCSFPFSQLLFTVWAKIKFMFCFRTTVVLRSYYGRTMVVLRYEMSRSVFTNSIADQQLLTSNATNNFRRSYIF